MSKPQLGFPSHNRTPKHHGCLNTLQQTLGTSLELAGVVWRSSWWLESRRSRIPSSSSSPVRLLRPAQTVHLKPIKDRARRVYKGSNLAPMTASHRYTVNHGV
ncbi:hypothetical protein Taro_037289 [Colocasia esculenta]|uniref:Uncharacterized protein n=1 Tax=Colocasia esculenta TaxID=4460 RepID=A0A843WP91_COLES|nr:hypothetical protein [Colocasia esculenta]